MDRLIADRVELDFLGDDLLGLATMRQGDLLASQLAGQ